MEEPTTPQAADDDGPDEVLGAEQLKDLLKIGYDKSLRLMKSGKLPVVKIGNQYKVLKSEVLRLLREPGLKRLLP